MIAVKHGPMMVCKCKSVVTHWPLFVSVRKEHASASADYDQRHHADHDARGRLLCHRPAVLDQLDEGAGLGRSLTLLHMDRLLGGLPAMLHGCMIANGPWH